MKFWNGHFEQALIVEIFHQVSAMHLSNLAVQTAGRNVLVSSARLNNGLLTDNALAFHLTIPAVAVENMPMATEQLNWHRAEVFYSDAICK